MLFLLTVTGFGCSGGKTDDGGASLAKSDAAVSRRLPDFVTLAERVQPVVVNVSTTQIAPEPLPETRPDPQDPMPEEDPMNEFLERYFGQQPPSSQGSRQRSQGSGFIIGSDGSILTNAHVVEDAKKIIVKLSDKREFEAKLLGKDLKTDVAIIKIDSKESLPTAEL
ncbi:MAG TPA: trypsin-like peptidase domain-containing protein, partial [Candidatus Binatia bacterium]|nr:trypsin-like peptidase domain-containing protein [Candidatus Binatia bacterium]